MVTREQLIDDGVPIESNRVRSKRGGLQSSMQYSNEMLAAIKTQRSEQALPALTRIEIRALTKHYNTAFSSLSEDEQHKYKDMPKIEIMIVIQTFNGTTVIECCQRCFNDLLRESHPLGNKECCEKKLEGKNKDSQPASQPLAQYRPRRRRRNSSTLMRSDSP